MQDRERERERETERERFGERGRATQWRGLTSTIGLNLKCLQRSTPENLSMATIDGLSINQTFGWCFAFLD
jgi:hypothetical protein